MPISDLVNINIADSILTELTVLLVLGIVLFPLTRHLLIRAGKSPTLPKAMYAISFTVVILVWVPNLILSNYLYSNQFGADSVAHYRTLLNASIKLEAAYYVLFFVAVTFGSLILIAALIKGSGKTLISKVSTYLAWFNPVFSSLI